MSGFTNKKGLLRIYDGTGTPYYLQLKFDAGDLTVPLGAPKTEETLYLPRGNMNSDAHYIEGSDEPLMAPVDLSFSCLLDDTSHTGYLKDWLYGRTVNSNTIVTTQGDTQRNGANNNPVFEDSNKKTFNIEYFLDDSNDICMKYYEVYFDLAEQSITEAEDGVTLSLSGKVYGTIDDDDGSFTSGTDVTA